MPISKRIQHLTREQLEKAPTEVLDALLSLAPTPTAELSIDTVLIILDVIEERVGPPHPYARYSMAEDQRKTLGLGVLIPI